MFLKKAIIPDDWQSDEARADILEADAELREKLDAYFAESDVHKQQEQTLSAVFRRAADVLVKLDGIAHDGTVYVYRRTDVKAVMTLLDGGLGAYAVLDKGANSLRDIDGMLILS